LGFFGIRTDFRWQIPQRSKSQGRQRQQNEAVQESQLPEKKQNIPQEIQIKNEKEKRLI
jgi:hypothetical protein